MKQTVNEFMVRGQAPDGSLSTFILAKWQGYGYTSRTTVYKLIPDPAHPQCPEFDQMYSLEWSKNGAWQLDGGEKKPIILHTTGMDIYHELIKLMQSRYPYGFTTIFRTKDNGEPGRNYTFANYQQVGWESSVDLVDMETSEVIYTLVPNKEKRCWEIKDYGEEYPRISETTGWFLYSNVIQTLKEKFPAGLIKINRVEPS